MGKDVKIEKLRNQIDEIDDWILTLIIKRMAIAGEIGALKGTLGVVVDDPVREEKILQRLQQKSGGHLTEKQIRQIFTAIFQLSKDIQNGR